MVLCFLASPQLSQAQGCQVMGIVVPLGLFQVPACHLKKDIYDIHTHTCIWYVYTHVYDTYTHMYTTHIRTCIWYICTHVYRRSSMPIHTIRACILTYIYYVCGRYTYDNVLLKKSEVRETRPHRLIFFTLWWHNLFLEICQTNNLGKLPCQSTS